MKILILGHKGMLGNMVLTYFYVKYKDDVIITNLRWDSKEFKDFIESSNPDFIINCIGAIPQRQPKEEDYMSVNYELPLWLDSLGIKVIHPDTDEPDNTLYGLSKARVREMCDKNTKIIKTSILGFERNGHFSLLEWFLKQPEGSEINGYINQFWNGNTTLEWSKWADKMIENWNGFKKITIIANPDCFSKYQVLNILKVVFEKDIKINPVESEIIKKNCLEPDFFTKELISQIKEMKTFYRR